MDETTLFLQQHHSIATSTGTWISRILRPALEPPPCASSKGELLRHVRLARKVAPLLTRPSPRTPFTALQIASVVLPFVLAMLFCAWFWQQVRAEAHDIADRTTQLLHEHVLRAVEVQDTAIAAVRARISGMDWSAVAASAEVAALLADLDEAMPHSTRIGIVDPAGVLVQQSGSTPPLPPRSHAGRDVFMAMTAAGSDIAAFGRPERDEATGTVAFPYARPALGADGRPNGGAIWTIFPAEPFMAMFRRIVLDPDDTVVLLRYDGTVLARHPTLELAAQPPLPPQSGPMQAMARATPDRDRGPPSRSSEVLGVSPIDSIERFYFARAMPGIGAAVVYGRTVAGLQREWLRRSLAVLAVAAMSCALLLYLTARSREAAGRELQARDQARQAAEQRATAEAARADAEAMLRQAQRGAMLGQIAAGMVHDFRNTVQTVHAGAALIERAAAQGNLARVHEVADMLRQAATRSGQLTQRLLSFRKGGTPDASCDPAETVRATCALLHAALGPAWRLDYAPSPGVPARIAGSQAELDSALMNMIINARDAMPAGGVIRIALRPASAEPGLPEGRYAELSVTDSGTGMDEPTLARATEAFFTTKAGSGTGLGLSSIRGFVDAVGGTMRLQSRPGDGTTVTLWLPAAPEQPSPRPTESVAPGESSIRPD